MDYKDIKKKTEADLHKLLNETRDKLRDLRFKDANKQLKNVREIRVVRQTIARILTILKTNHSDRKTLPGKAVGAVEKQK